MTPGRWSILLFALYFVASPRGEAQFAPKDLVVPSLVADTTTIVPGKTFTAGVRLKLADGWHAYWQFPGDAGDPPKIEWELPEGFKAGPIQWPIPESQMDEGDLISYNYTGEVLLPVEIKAPAQLQGADIVLKAKLRWLVCEKTCIPGRGNVELKLPAGETAAPANAELFDQWRKRLPKTGFPFKVTWDRTKADEFSLRIDGVPADQKVEFFPLPPEGAKPGHPKVSNPGADGSRTITVPIIEGAASNLPWKGVAAISKADGSREGWEVAADQAASSAAVSTPPAGVSVQQPMQSTALPAAQTKGILGVLFVSFLGGLVLNVMPCVLPVIALKIFGFVKQAGDAPERVFRMGLAFVAGVFVFFLGLATAVVILKAAGRGFNWGFQFQNPYVFAGLIALVFVFGLNMLGVFEVTLSSHTATALSNLSSREGYSGAFLHGMFTTLLGTSCTAPFLSASLGYATTQSAAVIFAIFIVIAAGMSLPYLLLTARPAWMRYLPKPGAWMERAKQLMGFVLLGVAVWLLGIFAVNRPESAAGLIHYLLALAVACWVFGTIRRPLAGAIAALIAVAGYFLLLQGPLEAKPQKSVAGMDADADGWGVFSEEKVISGVERGQPVFIDFTADWCINCKVYEKAVLDTDAIRSAFREKKVVTLRADWTNGDPTITRWLKRFERVGVPLYVLYRPGEAEPVVLDALTKQILLHHLSLIKG